ncbi:MAG: response regulator transcription factor [Treponema sp.]|nr:response regulator transcription factor [Spirochaetia bacterium]MDD7579661.1 response regulator transcription factor [Treponema sp.]MDY3759057.1 response regulator transcription factor [Treponema sp.]MDY4130127.1 response regulator transcription factor [Treponema sp.]MDY5838720.1 response regulator transcription factor [Treponema sp.]
MKTSILIIEDIPEMADLMSMYLENDNFDTVKCESAEKAIEQLSKGYNPALVLLDINLPGMSGFDFLKEFREKTSTVTPVIIVSARDADEDIIEGLGLGADEFVTKPFSPKVLVARVKAKLSRLSATEASVEETISFGPYTIFLNSCILKRRNEKIQLSTKEYEVLEFMARNPGKEMSPETIYSGVWKNHFGDISAVAVYIQRLRKKIEENPSSPKYLCTVFGMGYKFEAN